MRQGQQVKRIKRQSHFTDRAWRWCWLLGPRNGDVEEIIDEFGFGFNTGTGTFFAFFCWCLRLNSGVLPDVLTKG